MNQWTETIARLRAENKRLLAELERTCEWKEDNSYFEESVWTTQCGGDYVYNEVPLTECEQKYCQGCGGKLVIMPLPSTEGI